MTSPEKLHRYDPGWSLDDDNRGPYIMADDAKAAALEIVERLIEAGISREHHALCTTFEYLNDQKRGDEHCNCKRKAAFEAVNKARAEVERVFGEPIKVNETKTKPTTRL